MYIIFSGKNAGMTQKKNTPPSQMSDKRVIFFLRPTRVCLHLLDFNSHKVRAGCKDDM